MTEGHSTFGHVELLVSLELLVSVELLVSLELLVSIGAPGLYWSSSELRFIVSTSSDASISHINEVDIFLTHF